MISIGTRIVQATIIKGKGHQIPSQLIRRSRVRRITRVCNSPGRSNVDVVDVADPTGKRNAPINRRFAFIVRNQGILSQTVRLSWEMTTSTKELIKGYAGRQ